jgi:hypothetical protein
LFKEIKLKGKFYKIMYNWAFIVLCGVGAYLQRTPQNIKLWSFLICLLFSFAYLVAMIIKWPMLSITRDGIWIYSFYNTDSIVWSEIDEIKWIELGPLSEISIIHNGNKKMKIRNWFPIPLHRINSIISDNIKGNS